MRRHAIVVLLGALVACAPGPDRADTALARPDTVLTSQVPDTVAADSLRTPDPSPAMQTPAPPASARPAPGAATGRQRSGSGSGATAARDTMKRDSTIGHDRAIPYDPKRPKLPTVDTMKKRPPA